MSQLRRDPITQTWSVIATARQDRPNDFRPGLEQRDPSTCPFCPGRERDTPGEVAAVRAPGSSPDKPGWSVRIVPNKYPAVSMDEQGSTRQEIAPHNLYDCVPGFGHHEVVITTPLHNTRHARLTPDEWDNVLGLCQFRMHDILRQPGMQYVLLFENHLPQAGSSREHPHLQLIGTQVVPDVLQTRLEAAAEYSIEHLSCMSCDLAALEERNGARLVRADSAFITYAPYASRVPYELRVVPRVHRASFTELPPAERRRFAAHLSAVLRLLDERLDDPPYNWVLHTAPAEEAREDTLHWYVEILPRLGTVAGFELGCGAYINPTPPEFAAAHLRGAG